MGLGLSPLSIPFLIAAAGCLAVALATVLIRGAAMLRVALLVTALLGLPWAISSALLATINDPLLATRLSRFFVGTIALLGPALLLTILAVSERHARYRAVVAVAAVQALAVCILTWSTDLVVAHAWRTPLGLWYPRAGPLNDLAPGTLVVWAVVGMALARRAAVGYRSARAESNARRLLIVLGLSVLSASDALLAHGIGIYPFSVVPIIVAIGVTLWGIWRHDLLHSRGIDRAAAYELCLLVGFGGLIVLLLWVIEWQQWEQPLSVVLIFTPLFGVAQLGLVLARRHFGEVAPGSTSAADQALELFVEESAELRTAAELDAAVTELLVDHGGFTGPAVLVLGERGIASMAAGAPPLLLDARVRAWLTSNRDTLMLGDLPDQRLGGLRGLIERFLTELGAGVVAPLVDRGALVGLLVVDPPAGERALRDHEKAFLAETAAAAARALTFIRLFREARARIEMAREMEVAAAVEKARVPGEVRMQLAGAEVIGHYQPAVRFGGDWWTAAELPDGRLFIAIGDITGSGVSAALVSAAVAGACETAQRMLGGGFEVLALLQLLDATVRDVGGGNYWMSCFAAVVDPSERRVTFANAGALFPYVLRREPAEPSHARLGSLVARGSPLGADDPHLVAAQLQLEPDDVLVFYSDALVDSLDARRQPYGERRLQRVLQTRVRAAEEHAAQVIIEDAAAHRGDTPLEDDVTVVVVRLGAASQTG